MNRWGCGVIGGLWAMVQISAQLAAAAPEPSAPASALPAADPAWAEVAPVAPRPRSPLPWVVAGIGGTLAAVGATMAAPSFDPGEPLAAQGAPTAVIGASVGATAALWGVVDRAARRRR